jgi:hypothetical protein
MRIFILVFLFDYLLIQVNCITVINPLCDECSWPTPDWEYLLSAKIGRSSYFLVRVLLGEKCGIIAAVFESKEKRRGVKLHPLLLKTLT